MDPCSSISRVGQQSGSDCLSHLTTVGEGKKGGISAYQNLALILNSSMPSTEHMDILHV